MARTLGRRLISGMGAYGYAQLVTVATQLISLPLFLSVWDVATYGTWLVITAIPFYLSLADAGVSTASGNLMIALLTRGEHAQANVVFQSAVAFLLAICALALTLVALALLVAPADLVDARNWRLVFLTLSTTVLLGLICSLAETVYKATQGYATGTYLVTTGRLTEWAGGIVGLVTVGSFLAVAVSALAVRVLYTLFMIVHSQRRTPHVGWGVRDARWQVVRTTSLPGLMFLMISLTNALGLQGFTLLVAAVLGPVATATFNAYRTIARIVVQVASTLSNPLWPELAGLYGGGQYERFRHVYRRAALSGMGIAAGGALVVLLVSPYLLELWSRGQIAHDPTSMGLFMLYAAVAAAWQIPRVTLMSISRHGGLAWKGLVVTTAALAAGALSGQLAGMHGIIVAMILGEALMWLICGREVRQLMRTEARTL